ncbi:hypothetical protein DY000_02038029 [Brassica cretica]|uniref:DUF287 domain-containing protein n=1 Tax=Brassica cretica TaxID=69181 RepID=A0ABQ7B720_BRACR|nr:hypothetical protein DY000_02038029 [Brassica cretica]
MILFWFIFQTIERFLLPTPYEETLMARIVEDKLEYDKEDGPSNMWSTWLTIKGKPIWWKELYELDVAAREFPKKKDKGKVSEEASSSNDGLENILKGFEERLMASLTEVNVKVETMGKRLDGIEKSQHVLKEKAKKMKAMEKRLSAIENCQYFLRKRDKKQYVMATQLDAIEKGQGVMKKKVRRMARKLKEKVFDNQDMGFNSQGMDFDWDFNINNYEEAKKEKEAQTDDAEMVDATQEHETEAQVEEGKDVEQETEGKDVQEEGEGKPNSYHHPVADRHHHASQCLHEK